MNSTAQKNELIYGYSSGKLGEAKSIFTATYLFLNSVAAKRAFIFDNMLGENLKEIDGVALRKLKYTDCINKITVDEKNINTDKENHNPLLNLIGSLEKINWKQIYNGFKEYNLPVDDKDSIKLIKMEPGTSVPLHSHNGREYILVLDGSFCDEYGEYSKGDMQINDQKIKHNPTACDKKGCICLSITENDIVFFGKYGSALNLFTFIKSFFK